MTTPTPTICEFIVENDVQTHIINLPAICSACAQQHKDLTNCDWCDFFVCSTCRAPNGACPACTECMICYENFGNLKACSYCRQLVCSICFKRWEKTLHGYYTPCCRQYRGNRGNRGDQSVAHTPRVLRLQPNDNLGFNNPREKYLCFVFVLIILFFILMVFLLITYM